MVETTVPPAPPEPTAPVAQTALTASIVSIVVAVACMLLFVPPFLEQTTSSPARIVLTGATLAVALLLHWVFLGIAAHRLQRSLAGWLALSVLLCPVGSAAALILLSWFRDEQPSPAGPPAPHGA